MKKQILKSRLKKIFSREGSIMIEAFIGMIIMALIISTFTILALSSDNLYRKAHEMSVADQNLIKQVEENAIDPFDRQDVAFGRLDEEGSTKNNINMVIYSADRNDVLFVNKSNENETVSLESLKGVGIVKVGENLGGTVPWLKDIKMVKFQGGYLDYGSSIIYELEIK